MSMETVTGVIVKQVKVGDYDKILTVLSPELGKIQVSAKGVRSLKNKNAAGTSVLAYSSFELKRGKEMYSLVSCDLKDNFFALHHDVFRLALGCYFAELASLVAEADRPSASLVRLLLNSLYFLTLPETVPSSLKCIYELRLFREIGLMPELTACGECGSADSLSVFDLTSGCALCDSCHKTASHPVPLSPELRTVMRRIAEGNLKQALLTPVPPSLISAFTALNEGFLAVHLAQNIRSLTYYHSLTQQN